MSRALDALAFWTAFGAVWILVVWAGASRYGFDPTPWTMGGVAVSLLGFYVAVWRYCPAEC